MFSQSNPGPATSTKVEIEAGRARWRTQAFRQPYYGYNEPYYGHREPLYGESEPFKIGINWVLSIEMDSKKNSSTVRLFPEPKEEPPFARFSLRVIVGGRKISTVHEGLIRTKNDFACCFDDDTGATEVVIDVEFLELKISDGGEDISIWPIDERMMRHRATRHAHKCFSRLLNESLLTDITINLVDGTLHAHRAVLSANSPVFHSMFVHDLKEKQSSTIDMVDMKLESCKALLSYMYGTINKDGILKHGLALLDAANKYDIPNLKDECEETLLLSIGLDNVFQRLEESFLYQLNELKEGCKTYLFDSGKIYDLGEEVIKDFIKRVDKEILEELFQDLLWLKMGEKGIKRGEEEEIKCIS